MMEKKEAGKYERKDDNNKMIFNIAIFIKTFRHYRSTVEFL